MMTIDSINRSLIALLLSVCLILTGIAQDEAPAPEAPPAAPVEEVSAEEVPSPEQEGEEVPVEIDDEAPAPVEAPPTEEPAPPAEETPAAPSESTPPVEEAPATPDAEPVPSEDTSPEAEEGTPPTTEEAPDEPAAPALVPQERAIGPIGETDRFLNLPVKNGAPKTKMTLTDGQTTRQFDIELSDQPDLWVAADLTAYAGKTVQVKVDQLDSASRALEMIETGETLKDAEQLYQEALRPQFHFSTQRGWINDPNGLVYHKGEYHLFYQHNPYGWSWGNMHWGHAISTDLVHWEQRPIAIYPKAYGDWVFSGGALVDSDNTAGFKTGDEDVMVAFFTSTGRGECLAYSNDRGRTWTEYEGNPVIEHEGRDPKVIWHEMSRQWVMAVYQEHEGGRYIAFYTSPDLKEWAFQSRIEGFYECPELFEMPVDLDPTNTKWVLYGADGDYLLGQFDGKTFTPEGEKVKHNYGNCFYASQMYSNVPAYDRRFIQVGWGKVDMPNMPFNQQMLFPCELHLRSTENGPRLHTNPVREIARAYASTDESSDETLSGSSEIASGELLDIHATLDVSQAQKLTFDVRGTEVIVDIAGGTISCLDQQAPLTAASGSTDIRFLVDRTTIEIYANRGQVYMPMGVLLDPNNTTVSVTVDGSAQVDRLRASQIQSVWQKRP